MKKARIMIAQDAGAFGVIAEGLQDYELVLVSHFKEAQYQIIEDGIALVIVGIHFDDSRAIDLISTIRNDGKHKKTPIIVVRLLPTALGDALRAVTDALVKLGIISQYLELEGDPEAVNKIKNAVNATISSTSVRRNRAR